MARAHGVANALRRQLGGVRIERNCLQFVSDMSGVRSSAGRHYDTGMHN